MRADISTSRWSTPRPAPEDILLPHHGAQPFGPDAALHVLPTLWFRNTWSWAGRRAEARACARVAIGRIRRSGPSITELGVFYLYAEPDAALLFCENETNAARVFGAEPTTPFPKDGIGDHCCTARTRVNPDGEGTKVAAHTPADVPAGGQAAVLVRLTREGPETLTAPFGRRGRADRAAAGRGG